MSRDNLRKMWQRVKCFFGYHELAVDLLAQTFLEEAMKGQAAQLIKFDKTLKGKPLVFKFCIHCGVKR